MKLNLRRFFHISDDTERCSVAGCKTPAYDMGLCLWDFDQRWEAMQAARDERNSTSIHLADCAPPTPRRGPLGRFFS